MKLSYGDIKTMYLADTGNVGSIDTNLISYFKLRLGARYQDMLSHISSFITEAPKTASTVVDQQYYHYPAGVINVEAVTVQINTNFYVPLTVVESLDNWNMLNTIPLKGTWPRFMFPRKDDFGVFPIPTTADYVITFTPHVSDRNLSVDDYTTGTVSIPANSTVLTGSGTTFTPAMIGRWFQMSDESQQGQGKWYRISSYTSSSVLGLETSYNDATVTGKTYRICQVPELPDQLHAQLEAGCVADYFSGPRSDIQKATWFNNIYWTGDGNNNDRTGRNVKGGLLGAIEKYSGRSDSGIVYRGRHLGVDSNSIPYAESITMT